MQCSDRPQTDSQSKSGRQCQFRSVPAFAGSGRDKPDLASVTVANVEDLQIHDILPPPRFGRSAAWWGSIKREFYVWKSGFYLELLTVAFLQFPHPPLLCLNCNKYIQQLANFFYNKIHPDSLLIRVSFPLQPLQQRLVG